MAEQEFLKLCRSKYQQINNLNELKDFYEYEKQFDKIMSDLSRTVLQNNISEVPADRRKKNTLPVRKNRDIEFPCFQ